MEEDCRKFSTEMYKGLLQFNYDISVKVYIIYIEKMLVTWVFFFPLRCVLEKQTNKKKLKFCKIKVLKTLTLTWVD